MISSQSRNSFITRRRRAMSAAWLLAACLLGAGCGTTMEDGFKPHGLDASPDMRKAYYASPFSDQANSAAGGDHDSGLRMGH